MFHGKPKPFRRLGPRAPALPPPGPGPGAAALTPRLGRLAALGRGGPGVGGPLPGRGALPRPGAGSYGEEGKGYKPGKVISVSSTRGEEGGGLGGWSRHFMNAEPRVLCYALPEVGTGPGYINDAAH